jgi:hypothetical protein
VRKTGRRILLEREEFFTPGGQKSSLPEGRNDEES